MDSLQFVVGRCMVWMTVVCGVVTITSESHAQSLRWYWCENSNNAKINAIVYELDKPAPAMTFDGESLQSVFSHWPLPIRIDEKSLEDCGISLDEPVKLVGLSGETWLTRLESILDQFELTWVPVGDGLQITSADGSRGDICCLYFLPLSLASNRSELIWSIEYAVTPDAWESNSGSSTVTEVSATADALVVRANMSTHIRLQQYLNTLEQYGASWSTIHPSERKAIQSMLANRRVGVTTIGKTSGIRTSTLKGTSLNRSVP